MYAHEIHDRDPNIDDGCHLTRDYDCDGLKKYKIELYKIIENND